MILICGPCYGFVPMMPARNIEDESSPHAKDYVTGENRGILTSLVNEDALSTCCNSHPELGRCLPGIDDISPNGKCYTFCSSCPKGGFCKPFKDGHHECHCYC
ncbi:hypothetical protein SLE2022_312110 [Rubroshorea leprosula]